MSRLVVQRFCLDCWSRKDKDSIPLAKALAIHKCSDCGGIIEKDSSYVRVLDLSRLEKYLALRKKIGEHRKRSYRQAFMALSEYCDDPFSLNREEMNRVVGLLAECYKPSSYNNYVVSVQRWYKWVNGGEEYPDCVKDIELRKDRLPEEVILEQRLTPEEVNAMVRVADHPRDRALIVTARAVGTRRGSFLKMRLHHLESRPYGFDVQPLSGKTFTDEPPSIIGSDAKILRVWLEHHPARHDKEAFLWVHKKGDKLERIKDSNANVIVKKLAREAGITKNVSMKSFRHTCASENAEAGLNEAQMRKLHGWTKTSQMPSRYIHLFAGDARKAFLKSRGIIKPERKQDETAVVKCAYCGAENPNTYVSCHFCGVPLTREEAEKYLDERKVLELLSNPEMFDRLKTILESAKEPIGQK
jgi:site-specific recombinase XerD